MVPGYACESCGGCGGGLVLGLGIDYLCGEEGAGCDIGYGMACLDRWRLACSCILVL